MLVQMIGDARAGGATKIEPHVRAVRRHHRGEDTDGSLRQGHQLGPLGRVQLLKLGHVSIAGAPSGARWHTGRR